MNVKRRGPVQHAKSGNLLLEQSIIVAVVFMVGALVGHFHGKFSIQETMGTLSIQHWTSTPRSTAAVSESNDVDQVVTTIQTAAVASESYFDRGNDESESTSWRTIQVFSGDTQRHLQAELRTSNATVQKWFSSHRQDQLVLGLLRNKQGGFFVDLAAGDAINKSNTLGLEVNAQWNGICIEPNPIYWYGLSYYRGCQVVAAVVGHNYMEQVYFRYSNYQIDYFGGSVATRKHDHRGHSLHQPKKLQFTVPLLKILQVNQAPSVVDYLNLDVEDAVEETILQQFPFSKFKFSIVTVSALGDGLQRLLAQAGYKVLKNFTETGGSLLAHESSIHDLDLAVLG